MRKQRSEYSISPEEELDLKHQGSVGQFIGKYGRGIKQSNISSLSQGSTPGREPAEGPDLAMSSPSHERWEQKTPERKPTEGQEQEQSRSQTKHHYK